MKLFRLKNKQIIGLIHQTLVMTLGAIIPIGPAFANCSFVEPSTVAESWSPVFPSSTTLTTGSPSYVMQVTCDVESTAEISITNVSITSPIAPETYQVMVSLGNATITETNEGAATGVLDITNASSDLQITAEAQYPNTLVSLSAGEYKITTQLTINVNP